MSSTQSISYQLLGQLLLPLQGVVNFFSPPKLAHEASMARPQAKPSAEIQGTALVNPQLMGTLPQASVVQVLRSRRAQDGRLVISGRMRDVCAELDRLCEGSA